MIKPLNSQVILKEWKPKSDEMELIIPDKKVDDSVFVVIDNGTFEGVSKGDKVIIAEFAGKGRLIEGEVFFFVDGSDLIGVIK